MHQKALSLPKEYTFKGNEHKKQSTGLWLQPCRCRYILLLFCFNIYLFIWFSQSFDGVMTIVQQESTQKGNNTLGPKSSKSN